MSENGPVTLGIFNAQRCNSPAWADDRARILRNREMRERELRERHLIHR